MVLQTSFLSSVLTWFRDWIVSCWSGKMWVEVQILFLSKYIPCWISCRNNSKSNLSSFLQLGKLGIYLTPKMCQLKTRISQRLRTHQKMGNETKSRLWMLQKQVSNDWALKQIGIVCFQFVFHRHSPRKTEDAKLGEEWLCFRYLKENSYIALEKLKWCWT